MKQIKWMIPLLFSVVFLSACGEKEEIEKPLPKEEVKIVQENEKEPKEKESKTIKEKSDLKIDVSKKTDQTSSCEPNQCSETKEKETRLLTKEEQKEEYMRFISRFLEMRKEQSKMVEEWNDFYAKVDEDKRFLYTEKGEKEIKEISSKLEVILQQHVKELQNYQFNSNMPQNIEKAIESIRADFIQALKYEIDIVQQTGRTGDVTPSVISVKLVELEEKSTAIEEQMEIKVRKVIEYYGIDVESYQLEKPTQKGR